MIEHDTDLGQITDGNIRYVLLRADVLMHIGDHLPQASAAVFLAALERSVSQRASGSFEHYRRSGASDLETMLQKGSDVARSLGWGRWHVSMHGRRAVSVIVENSPFAAGFGPSPQPVCGAICGALRAVFTVLGESDVLVEEQECSAQGAKHCRFHVDRNNERTIAAHDEVGR